MKHLLVVLATLVAPFFASAQEAPNASLVRVGPMPTDQTALGELITAMQAYSRDTCGIALLLRVDPAAFPNDVHASPDALAQQMGAYFARTFSVSTRIYLTDREPGPAIVLAHVNGHLFARAREFQSFNLRRFTEMGPQLAVANHSIKQIQKALLEDVLLHNRDLARLWDESLVLEENLRDLAETQLLLLGTTPEKVSLSAAARANPRTKVEREMAKYLDAQDAVEEARVERADVNAAIARGEAAVARNDCAFAAPDQLYGAEDIATLRPRVSRDHGRSDADLIDADIMRWIFESGFCTPA